MTHFQNYGNDRLALYTFTNVIKFIQRWTNLRFMSLPPLELGKKYFELFPDDVEPLWGVSHIFILTNVFRQQSESKLSILLLLNLSFLLQLLQLRIDPCSLLRIQCFGVQC